MCSYQSFRIRRINCVIMYYAHARHTKSNKEGLVYEVINKTLFNCWLSEYMKKKDRKKKKIKCDLS